MHLFGGNGKGGKHSASGRGSGSDAGREPYDGGYYDDRSHDRREYGRQEYERREYSEYNDYDLDDDYDYDRRYKARQQRYASRQAAYNDEGRRRFASDDIISREERRASRPRWPRRLAVTLGILAVVIIGAFAWYRSWAKAPDTAGGGLNDYGTPAPEETGIAAVAPDSTGNKRDGVYTFLVSGIDVVGYHNDTNLVGMFDTVNGKLNIVSLPRDMLVNIGLNIKKINQPYAAAKNNSQDATQALLDTVADILGYEVDMYAFVNIQAAADIVDAIGGVNFTIPFDMDWDAPDQDLYIHIKAGPQTLNGEHFVNAMRFRMSNDGSQTYARGDIERIEFQQKLLMALASQTLSLGNITNLPKIYDIVMSSVDTTLSLGNIAYLAAEFLKLSSEDISFMTLPSKPDGTVYGESYVIPYIDDWLVMVNEYFNPFTVEITRDNVDMIATFDNGATFDTTQGYVAGGETHFYGYYY